MKKSLSERIFQIFNILFMCILMACMLYPMLHVLFASISDPARVIAHRGVLWKPLGFSIDSYKMMLSNSSLITGFFNIIKLELVAVPLNVVFTSFGAYYLTRKGVYFRKQVMFFIVFTMYFSGGMIPFYFAVKSLGLENSFWSLVLPTLVSTYNLIIMRTSFAEIPDSLIESAQIDGAGHFKILYMIVYPLSKSILAVMVLYYAVNHWNTWFHAMLFLSDREKFPLQLILREILIQNSTSSMMQGVDLGARSLASETVQYAIIIASPIPILCVYPFIQKYIVKGVMLGAVKG